MKNQPRVLFVDDDPALRTMMPEVLVKFGFKVTVAETVAQALKFITTQTFDVLISDLNIGQPGDGFTVVSAMRRTQPNAITFILTGYPAFETALEAIRQQVDDYLVKPADVQSMVEKILKRLARPTSAVRHIEARRLAEVLAENQSEIIRLWLAAAREDVQIGSTRLSDRELTDHLPHVVGEVVGRLRGHEISQQGLKSAAIHGKTRFQQGVPVPSIVREAAILQDVISHFVQENLFGTDLSFLVPDIVRVGQTIQAFLEESIRAYLLARHSFAKTISGQREKNLLLMSSDREIARLREYVLKQAGYFVTRAHSLEDAMAFLNKKFDALIVSYSLSTENVMEITERFRQHNPNSPVITIAKGKWQDRKIDTDFAVTGEDGPEALIETMETALMHRKLRPAQ
ncbi:MAG TPA: response regulator [Candidatus Angelobacter sp.]|nr:response regulator [Candidatus Angelobacter sp.]